MTSSNEQQAPASHLSLLVEATNRSTAAGGAPAATGPSPAAAFHDRSLAETMLRRGLENQAGGAAAGAPGGPLREELLRQKQAQAAALHAQQSNPGHGLLQQLSESQQLSQQISSQLSHSDIRSALASAQLRQAPQLSNSDIMALARTGAIPGLGGIIGTGGLAAGQRLGELELQSLEELERRQRRMASGLPPQVGGAGALTAHVQAQSQAAAAAAQQESESAAGAAAGQANTTANGQKASLMGMPQADFAPESGGPGGPRAGPAGGDKESRRDPGSVVVPCRARGMPMDHNFKTAYFVIPENVRHGEELICSYFACRNAGVKFRYCSHCKVPVAKRNFRKRHRHGDTDKSKAIGDDDDQSVEGSVSEENNDGDLDDVPAKIKTKDTGGVPLIANMQDINRASAGLGSQALNGHQQRALDQLNAQQQRLDAQAAAQHAAAQDARAMQERSLMMAMPPYGQAGKLPTAVNDGANLPEALAQRFGAQAFATGLPGSVGLGGGAANTAALSAVGNAGAQAPAAKRELLQEAQKEKWLSLLASRPLTTDGDTMSAWLMEVLAVSDPTLLLGSRHVASLTTTMTANAAEDKGPCMDSEAAVNKMIGVANEEALKALEAKRALAQAGLAATNESGCNVSFTEWRDRKKQKKGLSKR